MLALHMLDKEARQPSFAFAYPGFKSRHPARIDAFGDDPVNLSAGWTMKLGEIGWLDLQCRSRFSHRFAICAVARGALLSKEGTPPGNVLLGRCERVFQILCVRRGVRMPMFMLRRHIKYGD